MAFSLPVLLLVFMIASLSFAQESQLKAPVFSAALDQRLSPKLNGTIVFPKLVLQRGHGYDKNTGVFTAQEGGMYIFVMTIKTICPDCSITVKLVREDEEVARLSVGNRYRVDQTSITSLVQLSVGQQVNVVVADIAGNPTLDEEMNTVFSGYLETQKPMFSAALDTDLIPEKDEVMVFSRILLERGSGYDKNSGVFTAPECGIYAFVLTIRTKCKDCMFYVGLQRNREPVASLSVGNDVAWDQDSITSFVELRTGEQVTVKTNLIHGIVKLAEGLESVFSGYLESRTPIFSATLPHYISPRANKNPVIVLPEVTLQSGNGYNKHNGIFTAPQHGIYVFVMTIRTRCEGECSVSVKLLRDDHIVASLTAGNNWKWDMTSVTSFVELLAGQEVKAKVVATTGAMKLGAYKYTYFSGYLL